MIMMHVGRDVIITRSALAAVLLLPPVMLLNPFIMADAEGKGAVGLVLDKDTASGPSAESLSTAKVPGGHRYHSPGDDHIQEFSVELGTYLRKICVIPK